MRYTAGIECGRNLLLDGCDFFLDSIDRSLKEDPVGAIKAIRKLFANLIKKAIHRPGHDLNQALFNPGLDDVESIARLSKTKAFRLYRSSLPEEGRLALDDLSNINADISGLNTSLQILWHFDPCLNPEISAAVELFRKLNNSLSVDPLERITLQSSPRILQLLEIMHSPVNRDCIADAYLRDRLAEFFGFSKELGKFVEGIRRELYENNKYISRLNRVITQLKERPEEYFHELTDDPTSSFKIYFEERFPKLSQIYNRLSKRLTINNRDKFLNDIDLILFDYTNLREGRWAKRMANEIKSLSDRRQSRSGALEMS